MQARPHPPSGTPSNPQAARKPGSVDVEAVLRGDRAAFEQLVRQESPRLFRVIARILRDDDEAQSVMQETYLQAYQRLHTFRRESKLTTWLYAIGINLARAALRKQQRYHTLGETDIEALQPQFADGMYVQKPETWNPEQVTERAEQRRLVHEAIDRLPDDYRAVIVLRDLEELSTDETAETLGISNGAARVRLHRARQALRALLADVFK